MTCIFCNNTDLLTVSNESGASTRTTVSDDCISNYFFIICTAAFDLLFRPKLT